MVEYKIMGLSTISWCDWTFNAWIGCTKIVAGCKFCYAEDFAKKYNFAKWGDNNKRHITANSTWAKPLAWNRKAEKDKIRYRVFCSSLSDVMEANTQIETTRKRLFDLILQTPHLDWLLLTKRPHNFWSYFPAEWEQNFPQNIWLGTSICTQEDYDTNYPRFIDFQKKWGVKVSFVSFEPLLQNINLHHGAPDWSIIGGESGYLKNARPMEFRWVKNIIEQIDDLFDKKHHIFFKQMGAQLSKKLKLTDKKGEFGIDALPPAYDWLKRREIPYSNYTVDKITKKEDINQQKLFV